MASIYRRKGETTFNISFYTGGRRVRRSLATSDEHLARLALAEVESKLERGSLGLIDRDRSVTDFMRKYLQHGRDHKSPGTVELDQRALACFFEHARRTRLSAITAEDVNAYQSWRLTQVKRATAHRDMQIIRAAMNWAVRMGYLAEDPCRKVRKLRVEGLAIEYIAPQELDLLLRASADPRPQGLPISAMIATAGFAGLRLGEILNLHWQDVDLSQGEAWVRFRRDFRPKSFRERLVPLCDRLLVMLKAHRLESPRDAERVFTGSTGQCIDRNAARKQLQRLAADLGLRCNWQILRHSFASHLVGAGVSIFKVSKFLGHASVTTTQAHYAHLAPTQHRAELNQVFGLGEPTSVRHSLRADAG